MSTVQWSKYPTTLSSIGGNSRSYWSSTKPSLNNNNNKNSTMIEEDNGMDLVNRLYDKVSKSPSMYGMLMQRYREAPKWENEDYVTLLALGKKFGVASSWDICIDIHKVLLERLQKDPEYAKHNTPLPKGVTIRLDQSFLEHLSLYAWLNIALAYNSMGQKDKAVEASAQMLHFYPDCFEARIISAKNSDPAKALPFIEEAVAMRPTNVEARSYHGAILQDLGRVMESIDTLTPLLDIVSRDNPREAKHRVLLMHQIVSMVFSQAADVIEMSSEAYKTTKRPVAAAELIAAQVKAYSSGSSNSTQSSTNCVELISTLNKVAEMFRAVPSTQLNQTYYQFIDRLLLILIKSAQECQYYYEHNTQFPEVSNLHETIIDILHGMRLFIGTQPSSS
ncbi:hypothetical protein SAMD00019534_091790 [Acytostelium subglobosum LB1]|uniref:hypothetical protein n=1 Tax=Acytostelium subglobosum LB1 TaxID=1410327 RepID=UPI000644D5E3|nr:hypothetical protein SAMD00019534_091790 [Acytostelium subglobosum LB1]GAM26004.1 hypothetical protein SAMD00019534_091790 [Acytostelium subglobosum LB1]|eukprot:XP_012751047.1 hypothetical protein SAMD00019534_091790 [Acytostelium subglobosum LB1]